MLVTQGTLLLPAVRVAVVAAQGAVQLVYTAEGHALV